MVVWLFWLVSQCCFLFSLWVSVCPSLISNSVTEIFLQSPFLPDPITTLPDFFLPAHYPIPASKTNMHSLGSHQLSRTGKQVSQWRPLSLLLLPKGTPQGLIPSTAIKHLLQSSFLLPTFHVDPTDNSFLSSTHHLSLYPISLLLLPTHRPHLTENQEGCLQNFSCPLLFYQI